MRRRRCLKARVVLQCVHAWIHVKVDKPVTVLFVGFLQAFDRAVDVPKPT